MCTNNLKYNYVIAGAGGYFLYGYHDIMNLPNVRYTCSIYDGHESSILKHLIRMNFSRKLNKIVKTPFAGMVNPLLYPHNFPKEAPICYVFFGTACDVFQSSYIDYLRKEYKQVKLVLYMQDLVSMARFIDFDKALSAMDLVITYDYGDSKAYGLPYHPTPMSYCAVEDDPSIAESDVYYCGVAKTRYEEVHKIYTELTKAGLKCDFNLMSMPTEAPRLQGVSYPNRFFTYEENLQHVKKCKAILEVMQEGAVGYTPRLWESIIYDKHLMTNNESLKESSYSDKPGIHILGENNLTAIIETLNKRITYNPTLKKSLSPIHLLEFIDELLS